MNLKQLSDQLGLSQTTVSRALNNYPEVNEHTRERVKLAARKHGYLPNSRATRLATGKAMTIGHIIPINSTEVFNPIFGDFIAGASRAYSKRGYELSLTIANEDSEESIYRQIASKGSVDGVIVHTPRINDPRITLLQQLQLPFVVHGRDHSNQSEYSWIDMNNRRAFYQATKLLMDLGHKNICLVNGSDSLNFAQRRSQGYIDALTDEQINIGANSIYSGDLTEANGFNAASAALNQSESPTAFLVSSYVGALGVRRAIHKAGLEMGRDISVIIHDDELSYFQNDDDIPQFTATRSSVRYAGERAAMMLLDIIDSPDKAPLTELLDAPLTIGASTGPAKK